MHVLPKFAKMLTLLSLGFLSTQALAQNFCNATHSGTSIRKTESWAKDYIGDYNYEIWYNGGNNSATFYSDGSFSCEFSNTKDYLCRSGYAYDMTKTWQELGHLYADFSVKMSNLNNIGYSYIGVYGWSNDPLIEYYIVDTWGSQYRPEWMQYKGTITVDGAEYDLYYHRQINQPAINGNADFDQYFSIRKQKRSCGTIDITKHFEEWDKVGWKLGKMYEAKVLGEGGNRTMYNPKVNNNELMAKNGSNSYRNMSNSNSKSYLGKERGSSVENDTNNRTFYKRQKSFSDFNRNLSMRSTNPNGIHAPQNYQQTIKQKIAI